jgi:hypothetical protein
MKIVIKSFLKAAVLAGIQINPKKIEIRSLGCPHIPKTLPAGKMGIYIFHHKKNCLKIGKAGVKSNARFSSQHYALGRAKSNLPKSLLLDTRMKNQGLSKNGIGAWIRENTTRTDILLDESLGVWTLNFLEAFLHCRYRPIYEGYKGQVQ